MHVGKIEEILRYPVKSLGGEHLPNAQVTEEGIEGDRIFALKEIATDFIVSAKNPRKWQETLQFKASLSNTQELRVQYGLEGALLTQKTAIEKAISEKTQHEVQLVTQSSQQGTREADRSPIDQLGSVINQEPLAIAAKEGQFFDFAPLHILTTSSLQKMRQIYPEGDFAVPRFRPNLLINTGSEADFVENNWVGKQIKIGEALTIKIVDPCPRCVMTTLTQGDIAQDRKIIKSIVQANSAESRTYKPGTLFKGVLGVYGIIIKIGAIQLNDKVYLQ